MRLNKKFVYLICPGNGGLNVESSLVRACCLLVCFPDDLFSLVFFETANEAKWSLSRHCQIYPSGKIF